MGRVHFFGGIPFRACGPPPDRLAYAVLRQVGRLTSALDLRSNLRFIWNT